jgi:hypothetical protein
MATRVGATARTHHFSNLPPGGQTRSSRQEKLGLKLEPRRVPTEILVIGPAEKLPTENQTASLTVGVRKVLVLPNRDPDIPFRGAGG